MVVIDNQVVRFRFQTGNDFKLPGALRDISELVGEDLEAFWYHDENGILTVEIYAKTVTAEALQASLEVYAEEVGGGYIFRVGKEEA